MEGRSIVSKPKLELFVVICRYGAESEIAPYYEEHVAWVNRHSADGSLLLAGPTPFNKGGVLLAQTSRAKLDEMLQQDSFAREGLVTYEVIEFSPRRGLLDRKSTRLNSSH